MVVEWAWCGLACGEELRLMGHHMDEGCHLWATVCIGQDNDISNVCSSLRRCVVDVHFNLPTNYVT